MKFVFRLKNTVGSYGKYVLTSMGWWYIPCYTKEMKVTVNGKPIT